MAGVVGVPWSPGWSQVGIILTSSDLCCPLTLHWDPKEQVPQELQSVYTTHVLQAPRSEGKRTVPAAAVQGWRVEFGDSEGPLGRAVGIKGGCWAQCPLLRWWVC